jgi:hypothetical protein
MDIEAILLELRNLSAMRNLDAHDARRLAELFNAMDDWIRKGGHLPLAWKRGQQGLTAHFDTLDSNLRGINSGTEVIR